MSILIIMTTGVIIIGICILHIRAILTCNIETTGTFIKYNIVHSGRGVTYEPVFRYYVNGEEYQGRCLSVMSLSDIQKQFTVDQTYTIYVNNKKPGYFAVYRKVPFLYVIGILVGILFLVMGVFYNP